MEDFELLDDLASIGIRAELRQGIDWGYESKLDGLLDGERDGNKRMYFTTDALVRIYKGLGLQDPSIHRIAKPFRIGEGYAGRVPLPLEVNYKGQPISLHLNTSGFYDSPDPFQFQPLWYLTGTSKSGSTFGYSEGIRGYIIRPRSVAAIQKDIEEVIKKLRC